MKKARMYNGKSAMEIIEEAVHIFRLLPMGILALYYAGSVPFILGLLYFLADMSRNPFAANYCSSASFLLAIMFIWMKCWQSAFLVEINEKMRGLPRYGWTFRKIARMITIQTIIQPSGFFILPLALLVTIPFGWVFAFYQNISAQKYDGETIIKDVVHEAASQAKLWPGQNHKMLAIFFIFTVFTLINIAVFLFILPHVLKSLLGLNSIFVLSSWAMLNTTFIAVTCGITYLCIDPLIKTAYALRCYYGSSLKSGDDLKTELKQIAAIAGTTLLAVLILVSTVFTGVSIAIDNPASSAGQKATASFEIKNRASSFSPEELGLSINEIMNRREFAWRMSKHRVIEKEEDSPGFFRFLFEWISPVIRTTAKWIQKIYKWFRNLMPEPGKSEKEEKKNRVPDLRIVLYLLTGFLVFILLLILWKIWKNHRQYSVINFLADSGATPDPCDEKTVADELPMDKWLALAQEFIEKGEYRTALRAIYFATLSYLSEQGLVSIAKYKSNRDYETEFKRRAHERQDALEAFSGNVRMFEKSWYGMYRLSREDVHRFSANHERILNNA